MFLEDELKKPFPIERLSWRVGRRTNVDKQGKLVDTNKDAKALMLVYIDSRDVQDRLDEVCGINGWCCEHRSVNNRNICRIGIKIDGEWVFKEDGAGDTDFEAEKGGLSDAFKRCAVLWGIGRYLYNASDFVTYVSIKTDKGIMPDWNIYKTHKDYLDDIANKISKTVKPTMKKRIEGFKSFIETATEEQIQSKKVINSFGELLNNVSFREGDEIATIWASKGGEKC